MNGRGAAIASMTKENERERGGPTTGARSGAPLEEIALLLVLLIFAFAVRAYFLLKHPIVYNYDAVTRLGLYDVLAVRRWLPIPQAFIMLHESLGLPLLAFRWVCALWSMAAIVLGWRFWRKLAGPAASFALAALFAFAPPFLLASLNPYQEAFFFTFLFGGMLLLESAPERPPGRRTPRLVAGSLLLGMAALCRFEAWALIPFLTARAGWRTSRARSAGSTIASAARTALAPTLLAFAPPALWLLFVALSGGEAARGSVDTLAYVPGAAGAGEPLSALKEYPGHFGRILLGVVNPRGRLASLAPWPFVALGLPGLALLAFQPPARRRDLAFYAGMILPILAVEAWAGIFFPLASRVYLTVFALWLPLVGLTVATPFGGSRRGPSRLRFVLLVLAAAGISIMGSVHSVHRYAASAGSAARHPVFGEAPALAQRIAEHAAVHGEAAVFVVAEHEREALAVRIYLHGSGLDVTWVPEADGATERPAAPRPSYWISRAEEGARERPPAGAEEIPFTGSGWRIHYYTR